MTLPTIMALRVASPSVMLCGHAPTCSLSGRLFRVGVGSFIYDIMFQMMYIMYMLGGGGGWRRSFIYGFESGFSLSDALWTCSNMFSQW